MEKYSSDEFTEKLLKDVGRMSKRKITKDDGRYLIFYTFGEERKQDLAEAADGSCASDASSGGRGTGRRV